MRPERSITATVFGEVGSKESPSFQSLLSSAFKQWKVPPSATTYLEAKAVYSSLCSYSHKPRLRESIVSIRGGIVDVGSTSPLEHWLVIFLATLATMLDLAIAWRPMSLFPLPLTRKFGFNGPVGFFFDESSHVPVERALGKEGVDLYRKHFLNSEPLASQLKWFTEYPDLTEAQILQTWSGDDEIEDQPDEPVESQITRRVVMQKATPASAPARNVGSQHGIARNLRRGVLWRMVPSGFPPMVGR